MAQPGLRQDKYTREETEQEYDQRRLTTWVFLEVGKSRDLERRMGPRTDAGRNRTILQKAPSRQKPA